MRLLPSILTLLACAPPDRPPGEVVDRPCAEVWRALEPGEVSPWGTSVAAGRAALGGERAVAVQGQPGAVQLGWPGGVERLLFATEVEPVVDPPPGFCLDGIDLPATLRLSWGDEQAVALGRLRLIGSQHRLEGAFIGEIPLDALPLDPPAGARAWAAWARFALVDGAHEPSGSLRPLREGEPDHAAGPPALIFEPPEEPG